LKERRSVPSMCRMVGVVFNGKFPMRSLSDLRHVAEIGKVPEQGDEVDGHRDGWGMVSFGNGSPYYLGRSPRPIHMDPSFDSALTGIAALERPNILICHARRGSEGEVSLPNTHPFISAGVTFAHNGGVKEFHPQTSYMPRGSTDSERVFALFVDRYERLGDVGDAIASILEDDVRAHEFTGLVFLASDGRALYGYREYGKGRDGNYYNLKYVVGDDCVVLYQESRSDDDAQATQVDNGSLIRIGLDLKVEMKRLN